MGIIESRRQILSLLIYLTATLLRYDLTLSHMYNPSWLQVLMVVKANFNNDVLGFYSRLLFLSAEIIAPILTKFYNVSIETQSVISDWKLSKVTPIII